MPDTYQFSLPLVAASQAQKHVTVNEALARLDAVAQLRVISSVRTTPPAAPVDGEAYLVPAGGVADWAGRGGEIALFANGGWVFLVPHPGWRLWNEAAGAWQMFDGQGWTSGATVVSMNGAATLSRIIPITFSLASGAVNTVAGAIPAFAQVTGITGRVTTALTGAAATWRLGVSGADDRYGSGLGRAQNSYVIGLSGAPVTYYAATDLLITGEGGGLAAGTVELAIHVTELVAPRAV
ncbi:MAG: DUF2793 domain-containing protein [Pseudomonadota bacterium]